jgi:hypothetical protein
MDVDPPSKVKSKVKAGQDRSLAGQAVADGCMVGIGVSLAIIVEHVHCEGNNYNHMNIILLANLIEILFFYLETGHKTCKSADLFRLVSSYSCPCDFQ